MTYWLLRDLSLLKQLTHQFLVNILNFSINNSPLNDIEMVQFQSAIQVLSQFEGMPQFEGIQAIIAKLKTDLKRHENKKK